MVVGGVAQLVFVFGCGAICGDTDVGSRGGCGLFEREYLGHQFAPCLLCLAFATTLAHACCKALVCLVALTDESFSLLTTLPQEVAQKLFVKIVWLNQMYWVVGTLIGLGIGAGLNELIPHLDFALTCLFVVLAYEQYQAKRVWWPCVLAVVAFVLASVVTVDYLLLLAVALCALGILLWQWRLAKRSVA